MKTNHDQAAATSLFPNGPASFSLKGTMRITDAEQLHESVQMLANSSDVTVVCDETDFVDASIVQVLLALKESLRQHGHVLLFKNVPSSLASSWRLAGFDSTLSPRP